MIDLTDSSNVPVTNLVDNWKEEHARKCKVFNDWCFENGVIMPKTKYPAYFEGGLVGVQATEPIEHREAFCAVPYKMLITVERTRRHPVLGPIIEENPQLFSEEEKGDWEQLTLVLSLIYEWQLGDESFWKPYIDLMPDVKFFCHWSEADIIETQDYHLIQHANEYKRELFEEWTEMAQAMGKYPNVFEHKSLAPEVFYKFYAQVCTRCFGWGLPSTAMIPMADNHNHSDVTVVQEIVHKGMHLVADRTSQYFTKTKYMNDYTICFDEADYADDRERTINVKGRYNKDNFESNKQFTSIPRIKDSLQSGMQLWDVPCIREAYNEDNDTEEESEDEEEAKTFSGP